MSLQGRVETTANIATILVAVLLSAVLVKVYLVPIASPRKPAPANEAAIGTSLKGRIPGVDWSKNGKTLVLAISTKRHFCQESTAFYRKLQHEVGKSVKMVAVAPQTSAEIAGYLSSEGVHVDDVRQAVMGEIGVRGTPTMILVNGAGVVAKIWVGKLRPEQEQQVMAALIKG